MSGSKTVESTAFEGARTQSARKHSIFRSMLTTHRQTATATSDTAGSGRSDGGSAGEMGSTGEPAARKAG